MANLLRRMGLIQWNSIRMIVQMSNKTIDLLGRYPFSDSITVTGNFDSMSLNTKELVKNCNFNFNSGRMHITSIDHMFDGCSNAMFTSDLNIETDTVTSASYAFNGCTHAKLPNVTFAVDSLVRCDHMFEDCHNAELNGVTIPESATKFESMFRNAKSAIFDDIGKLPTGTTNENGIYNYSELFCGCESGIFPNLSFADNYPNAVNANSMFYYCRSMNCGDMEFENVSDALRSADYMFYAAGSDGAKMFDGKVFRLSNLVESEKMFTNSNFDFSESFFNLCRGPDGFGETSHTSKITSISKMFAGCKFCGGRSPTVVLGSSPNGQIQIDEIDEILNGRLDGYYDSDVGTAIYDFSRLYEGSSFNTLDLRGISNHSNLCYQSNSYWNTYQNFGGMCRNCGNLETILGFLPPHASTYESMFEGCSSLSVDLSKMFKNPAIEWTSLSGMANAYHSDGAYDSYTVKNIRNMFSGCKDLHSSNDEFDLMGLLVTVKANNTKNPIESISDAFPPIRIATHDPIPGLIGSIYDITDVSKLTGTIRFNSFKEEPFETIGDKISEFGLYSKYANSAFSRGYYRYGGRFASDPDKCFFIIYYPVLSDDGSTVLEFERMKATQSSSLTPHGWTSSFNTDISTGSWNVYSIGDVYAGIVCDLAGNFIKYAFIGNYERNQYDRKKDASGESFTMQRNFSMPVTYFDGGEDEITPL